MECAVDSESAIGQLLSSRDGLVGGVEGGEKEERVGWNGERGGAGRVGRSRMARGEKRGGVEW